MGHKTNLITFKSIEIISHIFSDHSGMKLVTTRKEMEKKHLTLWRLKNMLLQNQWVNK